MAQSLRKEFAFKSNVLVKKDTKVIQKNSF